MGVSLQGPVNVRGKSLSFMDKLSENSSMEFREHVVKDSIQLVFQATLARRNYAFGKDDMDHAKDIIIRYGWFYYCYRDEVIFTFIKAHLEDWLKLTGNNPTADIDSFVFTVVADVKEYLINTPKIA